MPGINGTGAPNTQDYVLGKGRVYLALIDDATGLPTAAGFRDLGNCPSFNVSLTVESRRHKNSRDCLAFTDALFVTSQEVGLSFSLDEMNFENLADFFSGDTAVFDNPHDATTTDAVISTDVVLGRWYELKTSGGVRVYNLGDPGTVYTLEKDDASDVLLVEGTDYEIDEVLGLVRLLPTASNIAAGDQLNFSITTGATTPNNVDQVNALQRSKVEGVLLFIQDNAHNCGQKKEYRFHRVTLTADGDLSMIGDEESVMQFTGVAEVNSFVTDASQVLTIREPIPA